MRGQQSTDSWQRNQDQVHRMSIMGQKLKHELRELILTIAFFFMTFQLLALTDALMLKHYGISVSAPGQMKS